MHEYTLAQLRQALDTKQFTSLELTEHLLKRAHHINPTLNAFVSITEEKARADALRADQMIQNGTQGLLTGIPIAQKDNFCTKGIRTSCGSKMLDNFIAPYNATTVEQFDDHGAVLLGKTNMDEFAMGSSNETSFYGPTGNPWNLAHSPGGSSGGSAAAVAAQLVTGATGTDTGGSIRQPAAFTGITGLKPTYGRVSRYGMIAFASSLDQGGPMTRTAEDAAMMLQVMAGLDAKDSTAMPVEVPDYLAHINRRIEGLTIGLPKEYLTGDLAPEIISTMEETQRTFEKLGARFVEITLKHTEYAVPVYYVIAPAECASNLARYDGVRFGYRADAPKDLKDLYLRSRTEGFGTEVKRRILIGTHVLSADTYDAYYVKAQKVRRHIRDDFLNAFKTVDLILTPTAPTTAFKIGNPITDPTQMYLNDIFTTAVNLAGLPAISIPAGFHQQLPIGVQLIGPAFSEAALLNAAHVFQQETDWHQQTPKPIL